MHDVMLSEESRRGSLSGRSARDGNGTIWIRE